MISTKISSPRYAGTRYATANGFYLSIVSALVGVLAFTESGKPLAQVDLVLVLTVSAFAIVICTIGAKPCSSTAAFSG